ncbi:MAG: sodium:proton antiporter, partial [Prevotella sp.]|nr:sodium:proton antiporter [Prevotella sp.]
MKQNVRIPHPLIAVIPLLVLVALIVLVINLFPDDALAGASQVALMTASAVCVAISMVAYKVNWGTFEQMIMGTVGNASVSILILLLIGMMSATWMISGVVPTLIYYGVQFMSPMFFLPCACIISSLISVITGTSWTTIATIGIALLGIGDALGIPSPYTAGAIISGAYFGDKMSPMSDTTVLASSVAGADLFKHIRYM